MDPNTQRLISGAAGAAGGAEKLYVEDVFSTHLYTGNGSTQTITNGIDLSGKGGLVWVKERNSTGFHNLVDTVRGASYTIYSNDTSIQYNVPAGLSSFNSNGFSVGNDGDWNENGRLMASWTFREAAKFFDVVTYTGNGSNRTIAHSLGSVPGTIIVKRTDTTGDWQVYHRSLANTEYLVLNSTAAKATGTTRWNSTTPTSTVFSLGTDATVNASGATYVAYLFAHDAGGFGESGNDSVVSCGSFTMASGDVTVSLGYEPQWLLIKTSTGNAEWALYDVMRGLDYTNPVRVTANTSNAEAAIGGNFLRPTPTGFVANSGWFGSSGTYIYIAIRRGPMKTPTDATKVFSAGLGTSGSFATSFPVDFGIQAYKPGGINHNALARLTGDKFLIPNATNTEATFAGLTWDKMTGWSKDQSSDNIGWGFRRAPGFFDVVAYRGNGATQNVSHNLSVAPELIIIKNRSGAYNWTVGSVYLPGAWNNPLSQILDLNTTAAARQEGYIHSVDSSIFKVVGVNQTNASGSTYIAYLFATLTGISKVGSYTGTGTTLSIDCGFTNGARFVLIKRTDNTGDWYVWDTARGIVSGNDPYLLLNSIAAEVTNTDYIDPLSSGFQISSTAPAAINANGGSFIFLAIA